MICVADWARRAPINTPMHLAVTFTGGCSDRAGRFRIGDAVGADRTSIARAEEVAGQTTCRCRGCGQTDLRLIVLDCECRVTHRRPLLYRHVIAGGDRRRVVRVPRAECVPVSHRCLSIPLDAAGNLLSPPMPHLSSPPAVLLVLSAECMHCATCSLQHLHSTHVAPLRRPRCTLGPLPCEAYCLRCVVRRGNALRLRQIPPLMRHPWGHPNGSRRRRT